MFWIALLGLSLAWMMIKLGFLSATASMLMFVVKVLLFVILVGFIMAVWSKFRGKKAE
jgi:flagellar motor component MotA